MQTFNFLPKFPVPSPRKRNFTELLPVKNTVELVYEKNGWKVQLRSFTWTTGNPLFRYETINSEGILITYSPYLPTLEEF